MKKLLLFWCFLNLLLLPLSACALEIDLSAAHISLGDTVEVKVLGAEGKMCSYTLLHGKTEVFAQEAVPCHTGILHPRKTGDYTLTVACEGEEESVRFTVSQQVQLSSDAAAPVAGTGIRTEGKMGTVFAQGDMRTVTVIAPGSWTARTDDDFITLYTSCGRDGDGLTFSVDKTEEERTGTIFLTSGQDILSLAVRQVAEYQKTQEEELSFSEEEAFILADGETCAVYTLNGEETDVTVSASGEWEAVTEDEFLSFTVTEEGLSLWADENDTPAARTGCVTLLCGNAQAYVYVHQQPASAGAEVLAAYLNREEATAYQDTLLARVETGMDAKMLVISMAGRTERYPAAAFAKEIDNALLWQVDLPAESAGEWDVLFAAEDEAGRSGEKKMCGLTVLPEEAAFVSESAVLTEVGSRYSISFTTTAAADQAVLQDENGAPLLTLSRQDGEITYAGPVGERERYIAWDVPLDKSIAPAFVRVGENAVPVSVRTVLTPSDITLFSQTDGWWQDKKYSISNLETSGCAVFSLSHALQLLGYTGEEITPERLAKTYAVALMKDGSGTMNSSLVGRAGDDFGFKTRYELYENPSTIRQKAAEGAVFSFSVVNGHIACVAAVSEDGQKCLIIDSAPSATFERKGDEPVYFLSQDGTFQLAHTPADIPGIEYCIETNSYGCGVYYLDMAYVARRGVRLIQPR